MLQRYRLEILDCGSYVRSSMTSREMQYGVSQRRNHDNMKEINGGHPALPLLLFISKWLFIRQSRQALFEKKGIDDSLDQSTNCSGSNPLLYNMVKLCLVPQMKGDKTDKVHFAYWWYHSFVFQLTPLVDRAPPLDLLDEARLHAGSKT